MYILHVQIHVRPEAIDAFRAATIQNASQSLEEPGVARFDFVQDQDDPGHFVLVEAYHSREAVAAHKETAHYHAWSEAVGPMLAEPRTRAWYVNVFPGDEGW